VLSQSTHALQLFDTAASLADTVSRFIQSGLAVGDAVVVVATAAHWDAIRTRLVATGIDVNAARAAGSLVTRDADILLATLMRGDRVDVNAFEESVGALLRQLRGSGRDIRIYGEMVDVLARAGEFDAARGLEDCWNRVADVEPITLLCGYMAEHFGNPRDARALKGICDSHTHSHADSPDVLGSFLLKSYAAC
jgi:hypothetical protein